MAKGAWRVSVGESEALLRQGINMRRGDFGCGVVAIRITIAHIINQNDHDVRVFGGRWFWCDQKKQRQ